MNARFDRSRFHIGAYFLAPYARTRRHIQDVKACGIDFTVNMQYDLPALDLMDEYGLSAIVSGAVPGWVGCDGRNAGMMAQLNPLTLYDQAASRFADHPAICGIDAGDEPSCLDFAHYGRVIERINALFPHQFAYLNLFPSYGFLGKGTADQIRSQLGCDSYAHYISEYVRHVPTDYICLDYYVYSASVCGFYHTLRTAADACAQTGRDLFTVLQVNSHQADVYLNENQLRYQSYSALAFGAKAVIWACYTAGWWYHQVLDAQGEKTPQYEKLRRVNGELRALGDAIMRYRRTDTHFVGAFTPDELLGVGKAAVPALDTACFSGVHAENGERLLAGEMEALSRDGSEALLLCAADAPSGSAPHAFKVLFSSSCTDIQALGDGHPLPVERLADGLYAVSIISCHAILLQAHP